MTRLLTKLAERADQCGDRVAVHRYLNGKWEPRTWRRFADDVARTADRLRRDGIASPDRVVLISANRYEWLVLDLAILSLGAVHVPLHAALSGSQARYQIEHCGASAVIVEDIPLLERLAAAYGRLPSHTSWYLLATAEDGSRASAPADVDLLDIDATSDRPAPSLDQILVARDPGDPATILYTSGTTGEPKGVTLTHGNLWSNAVTTAEAFGLELNGLRLNVLPLSHVFARVCDLYMWLVQGCELAVARRRETVLEDLRMLRPSWFNAVPYWFGKFHEVLQGQGRADEPGALRELLGGRVEYCCSGGAPLPEHLFDYYQQHGVPILQGYGLTETSPVVSISRPGHGRCGASGQPLRDVQVRLADDGELLVRGPNVMAGYYRDEDATSRAIRDGWFYTGDLARIDADGYLYITGRKKELIVTAGGKNIAPAWLESILTQDPVILQAMVVGDRRKFLSALVVLDQDAAQQRWHEIDLPWDDWTRCVGDERLVAAVESLVATRLADVAAHEQVRRVILLEEPFSIEGGELTAKLSLRREVIESRYRARIEALYEASTRGTR